MQDWVTSMYIVSYFLGKILSRLATCLVEGSEITFCCSRCALIQLSSVVEAPQSKQSDVFDVT